MHSWLIFALFSIGTALVLAAGRMAKTAGDRKRTRLAILATILLAIPAAAVLFFIVKDGAGQMSTGGVLIAAAYTALISTAIGVQTQKVDESS